jgi:hypothetical protein
MSRRKQKPGPNKKAAADDPEARRRDIERLIESGKVKEAFKEAKLAFHQNASAENRHLVERTYLLRIRSLLAGGMPVTAQEVAQSALEFGVTDPGLLRELALLLPRVGLADRALAFQEQLAPELRAELLLALADRAVLHPQTAGAVPPEIREAAGTVRLALAALDEGNDARALEVLQPIPRSSPVADWRYFVRGLVAFRQHELEQAKANWQRLHPDRAARTIARALLPDAAEKTGGEPPASSPQTPGANQLGHLQALEPHVFGEPVLARVTELRKALDRADFIRALQIIIPLRQTLGRIDRRLAQRLTEVVLLPLSAELKHQAPPGADRLIKDFKTALEPLPWDPNWHRFDALLWEGPRGNPEQAARAWRRYLRDLEQGATGLPGEVRQIQALVWRRIGALSSELADENRPGGFPFAPKRTDRELNELRTRATEALQQSLRLDPNQRQTHQFLIDNFTAWNQPDQLVAALEALLKTFPNDVDALWQLIHQHQRRDQPELVLSYVERQRKLKPLDTELDREEMWGQLALARHRALKGQWDEGRAAFARVETALAGCIPPYLLLARRAAFEFKASNTAQAEELVEKARLLLKEPAVLWLALSIEAVRYALPPALQQRFRGDFQAALARKATSETAGAVAHLIGGYFAGQVDYPGRAGHVGEIFRYLKRTTRLKYREPDLRQVCALLADLNEDDQLLTALLKRGLKLFPQSPFFLWMDAERDLVRNPLAFNARGLRDKLERALALARASQDPGDAGLVPDIQALLARVQDLSAVAARLPPFGLPFMPPGGPRTPEEINDVFASLLDQFGAPDLGFEEDDMDDAPPRPTGRKRR